MMATSRTALVNAHLLDPASGLDGPGGVLVSEEIIAEIGPSVTAKSVPAGTTVIDCAGKYLAPGLVDMRVQLRDPGEEHKETLATGGLAAVAGGVTSMVCLPNTDPVLDEEAVLEFVARRARLVGLAKVYAYGAATKGLKGDGLAEMAMLADAGALGFTDGVRAIANAQVMRRVLGYAATFDFLVIQHPEEPTLATGDMNEGEMATRLGLAGIPVAAEAILLERDMRLVELTGARYHAAHLSTADGVDIIRRAKARGLPVTAETAPPYFALNELAVGDYRTFAKLSPPLRSEADRQAIVEGLRDGTIDAIASDHAPQPVDGKRQPMSQAEPGGIGLETLLPITLELYHNGHLSLMEAIAKVTCEPARVLGLEAGQLKIGHQADMTVFDPNIGWKIDPDKFQSKSKNSPFDGRPVQGRVLKTVVDGRLVFER